MRAPFFDDVRLMHVLGTFGACVVCVVSEGCETCYHLQVYNKTHSSGHSNFQLDKINLLNSLIGEDFRQIAQCVRRMPCLVPKRGSLISRFLPALVRRKQA